MSKREEQAPMLGDSKVLDHTMENTLLSFQFAASAMAGGAAVSIGTLAVAHLKASPDFCYSAGLSLAICTVAYINYCSMANIKIETIKSSQNTSAPDETNNPRNGNTIHDRQITYLRYADWLVTMPLISLKLLHLAKDGTEPSEASFLTSVWSYRIIALSSFFMIASALVAVLAFEIGANYTRYRTQSSSSDQCASILLYVISFACLIVTVAILFMTSVQYESKYTVEIILFATVWLFYPLVHFVSLCCELPIKDILYVLLDVFSKPVLSLYLAGAALRL
jgi:bacteriorhodopsin